MTHEIDYAAIISSLTEPFPPGMVQWRPGSVSRDKKRAQALAYVDSRCYQDRLNEVCPNLWGVHFRPWGNDRLICELTIGGLTRSSTGETEGGDFAPGTSCEAQAFKRACVAWGLGRYLYDLPAVWVEYDDQKKRLVEVPELPTKFLPRTPPSNPQDTPQAEAGPVMLSKTETLVLEG